MKKIAADRNYRMFKRAGDETRGRISEIEEAIGRIQATTGAPNAAAHSVFVAIQQTALIHSRCTKPGLIYGSIELPGCESELIKLLKYTEDALSGMKDSVWKKYAHGLFARLHDVNETAAPAIITFIAVRNV